MILLCNVIKLAVLQLSLIRDTKKIKKKQLSTAHDWLVFPGIRLPIAHVLNKTIHLSYEESQKYWCLVLFHSLFHAE